MNKSITQQAEQLARLAHQGQLRKDGMPYITHPKRVVDLLKKHNFGEEIIAAGWLHDVVEDTDVTSSQIRQQFGVEISSLVDAVSENPDITDQEKKKKDRVIRVANGPEGARAIAVADTIDNLTDLERFYEKSGHGLWKHWPITPKQKLETDQEAFKIYSNGWQSPLLDLLNKAIDMEKKIVEDYYKNNL